MEFQDIRTSIKDEKLYKLAGTPKVSSEKVSLEKQEKMKSSKKNNFGRVYSPPI